VFGFITLGLQHHLPAAGMIHKLRQGDI